MGYFQVQLRAYSRLEPNLKPGQEDYHSCKGLYPASRCLARRTASWAGAPATGDDWFDGREKIHRQRKKHVRKSRMNPIRRKRSQESPSSGWDTEDPRNRSKSPRGLGGTLERAAGAPYALEKKNRMQSELFAP
jgi:hypothetical protein